ncbi:MAG: CAP domain-containing protein [Coriobacteriia bacterium]|nr:CAP domain-containing protein [Coriobacteriia bacterium]
MGFRIPRILSLALVTAAVCATFIIAPPGIAGALDTSTRSAAAIQDRWAQLKPSYSGSEYAVAPSVTAPYAAGSLNAAFLRDGLNAVNYARFLAGIPDDVVLDATLTNRAQYGAVLLAASTFSHTPPKPANMDQAFYDLGYGATSSSNIGWGHATLAQFNSACMDDSDTSNIDRLGHRRWLLNPSMLKTGMGFASYRSDTFVFDRSRSAAVDYDSLNWPCAGYFPVEMLGTSTAWSVQLNPAKYSWTAGRTGHTVVLRRVSDGRTWTFSGVDTDTSGKYFNFETSGYGVNNCFVFRPDAATLGSYRAGDVFDVTVSGGITLRSTGAPATISYRTELMSQNAPIGPDTTPPNTTSDVAGPYTGSASIALFPTDNAGGSGVAVTEWILTGAETRSGTGRTVNASTVGTYTLEYWSVDSAGNEETPHKTAAFEVNAPVWTSTRTSIGISGTLRRSRTVTISGYVSPGAAGDTVAVYMRRPGSRRWTRIKTAATFTTSGRWATSYRLRYRGTHYFKAVFVGAPYRYASSSGSLRKRVR